MKNFSTNDKLRIAAQAAREWLAFSEATLTKGSVPAKLSEQLKGLEGSNFIDEVAESLGFPEMSKSAMAETKKLTLGEAVRIVNLRASEFPLTIAHFSKK